VVRFHYRGWTAEGTLFDETTQREPVTARMDRLIKGLREGLALMTEGERRRLWVPRAMGFLGIPGKPQGDLVLEVELLAVLPPPQTPADVAAPPPDALQGPGGLRYRILQAGTGTRHPGRRDRVTVHYSGWTTDGKLFDSSLQRDAPQTFALDEVIKGWSRGLPLLVEGDRARFWIPARMAYQGEEGKPQGMLVFDIQLLKVWN
jgi:peptidylprolyl isomerase